MLDRTAAPTAMQRTRGRGELVLTGASDIARLYQDGAAKLRLPRRHGAAVPEAVMINTAGGLTGGDAMEWRFEAGPGARLAVTTQACEKVYRSSGGAAEVSVELRVGEAGRIDWLPQETILFDNSALERRLDADVAPGGRLLMLEAVLMGRAAMGETLTSASLRDRWRIRRDGRLLFADEVRLEGAVAEMASRAAVLGGAGAYASLLLIDEEAERWVEPVRAAVGDAGGATAFDGKLFCRIAETDGAALRRRLLPALAALRGDAPLPRVWTL